MVIKSVNLETVCGVTSKLPENKLPEVAFAGRSNVGKSSLINALMNRKAYARTSAQPGKTQTINFYNINDQIYFTDLPGYGYAKVSKTEVAKWGKMIEKYLHSSKMLYDWVCTNGYTPVIIATKLDKIKRSQTDKQIKLIRTSLGASDVTIIPFSATSKQGRDEIYEIIDKILEDTV